MYYLSYNIDAKNNECIIERTCFIADEFQRNINVFNIEFCGKINLNRPLLLCNIKNATYFEASLNIYLFYGERLRLIFLNLTVEN